MRTTAVRAQALEPLDETRNGTYWFDLDARHPAAARLKRVIDVVVSAVLVVLLAPLVLGKRDMVRRIGFRGNPFPMHTTGFGQLLDVLDGSMSLVGPRPLPPAELEHLPMGSRMRRFSVRPGITGLWRVEAGDEVMLDRRYINEWSLALDLGIVLRTLLH